MHNRFVMVAVLAFVAMLTGCGGSSEKSSSPSPSTTTGSAAPASTPAEGATQSLGTISALGKQVQVNAEGTVTAGTPATIAVKTGQKVDDVSGWLGNQGDTAKKVAYFNPTKQHPITTA